MTAPFSLSSIDSASLDWPELPELDTGLDVLAPTPWAPSGGATAGWRELGACMDELAATRALTELLDARARSARHRAGMCLRASFVVDHSPAWRMPVPAGRDAFAMPYRGTGGPMRHAPVSGYGRSSSRPYGSPDAAAMQPPSDGASLSVQSWLANLAPLATMALLLGAWFVWLR